LYQAEYLNDELVLPQVVAVLEYDLCISQRYVTHTHTREREDEGDLAGRVRNVGRQLWMEV
jgi:hypothetical protein